jgi:RNA polymerase sigma-70 factor (ECF subfamily)
MNDNQIVDLYWARDEQAIDETRAKYGQYCYAIAYNILQRCEDAEESVNDTYLDAWNAMPPHKPSILSTFLGKITRRISLDRLRRNNAEKRGGGQAALSLDELMECIPDGKRYSYTFHLDSDRALEIREDFAKRNMLCEQEWNVPGSTTFKTITEFKKQYTIFDVYGCWIDIDGTLVNFSCDGLTGNVTAEAVLAQISVGNTLYWN